MARYRRPPDPRLTGDDSFRDQEGREKSTGREPVPWRWLGLGIVVTILAMILAGVLIAAFLIREPLAITLPTPTIIRLTAPPRLEASSTSLPLTATPLPTFTPPPTPDVSIAPSSITVGYYAQVSNTENIGVSLRGGPSTDNIRLQLVPEGEYILIIDGPEEGSGFIWWLVRLSDGNEGWIAGDFLNPAAAPGSSSDE